MATIANGLANCRKKFYGNDQEGGIMQRAHSTPEPDIPMPQPEPEPIPDEVPQVDVPIKEPIPPQPPIKTR